MNKNYQPVIPRILVLFLSFVLGNILVITSFWPKMFLGFEQIYDSRGLDRSYLGSFFSGPSLSIIAIVILFGTIFYVNKGWSKEVVSKNFYLKFGITAVVIVSLISLSYSACIFSMMAPMLDFSK